MARYTCGMKLGAAWGSLGVLVSVVAAAAPVKLAKKSCRLATAATSSIDQCESACDTKDPEACATAAKKYWGGEGVKLDTQRCLDFALRACALHSAAGCATAASVYSGQHDFGGVKLVDAAKEEQYERRALPLYEAECTAGVAGSCDQVAWWYGHGMGSAPWLKMDGARVKTAHARYLALATAQCEAVDDDPADTCSGLAYDYDLGTGVPQDKAKAAAYWKRGCDRGYAKDCDQLSSEATDPAIIMKYGELACTAGLGSACWHIGMMTSPGPIQTTLYRRACDLGNAAGCSATRDFKSACRLGDDDACKQLSK